MFSLIRPLLTMSPMDPSCAVSHRNERFSTMLHESDGRGQSRSEMVDVCVAAVPSGKPLCPPIGGPTLIVA